MTAQPSPEAVDLVQAVIRAERECAVEEERNGFTTPSHWLLVGKLDATTEALFRKIVRGEEAEAMLIRLGDWLKEQPGLRYLTYDTSGTEFTLFQPPDDDVRRLGMKPTVREALAALEPAA